MLHVELDENIDLPLSSYDCDIQFLVDYWHHICPLHGIPGRQHFDPVDIPNLLPHIWLLDVVSPPWRFRLRLIGTAIVAASGRDATGLWCDEAFVNFETSTARTDLIVCARNRVPVYRTAPVLPKPSRSTPVKRLAQRVHLPLAADGARTDMILSLTRYIQAP